MELIHFIVNFFRDGGFFLYPLAAIFVVGVGISIERFIYLTNETTQNRRVWGQVSWGMTWAPISSTMSRYSPAGWPPMSM